MGLRLAVGSCRCADGALNKDSRVRELCSRIVARISVIRTLSPEYLVVIPMLRSEEERIEGSPVHLNTYRDQLPGGEHLIVVQGFLPSWRFPNYIGTSGVGHMYAEGVVVAPTGQVREAEEDYLWEFR